MSATPTDGRFFGSAEQPNCPCCGTRVFNVAAAEFCQKGDPAWRITNPIAREAMTGANERSKEIQGRKAAERAAKRGDRPHDWKGRTHGRPLA